MPVPVIKKRSKEGKGSVKTLENKWSKAKSLAKKEGKKDNYAYVMGIFNKMTDSDKKAAIALANKLLYAAPSVVIPNGLRDLVGNPGLKGMNAVRMQQARERMSLQKKPVPAKLAALTAIGEVCNILLEAKAESDYEDRLASYNAVYYGINNDKTSGLFSAALQGVKALAPKSVWGGVKRVATNTALMSGMSTLADEDSRAQHGWTGTFARKMASPKSWLMGAGATVATPLLTKGMTGLHSGVAKLTGNKLLKGSANMFKGNFNNSFSKTLNTGVSNALRKTSNMFSKVPGKFGKDASKWIRGKSIAAVGNGSTKGFTQSIGRSLNPYDAFALPGLVGMGLDVAGPWSVSNAPWEEDFYKFAKGGSWEPWKKTSEYDPYRARA